jgi:hypothetical protein
MDRWLREVDAGSTPGANTMNFDHRREIVAAKIGTLITTNRTHILSAIELKLDVQFIDRLHMEMMAAMDLGPQWKALAEAPTIFRIDPEGRPVAPGVAEG